MPTGADRHAFSGYVRLCSTLSSSAGRLGIRGKREARGGRCGELATWLELAEIDLDPATIELAGTGALVIAVIASILVALTVFDLAGARFAVPLVCVCVIFPMLLREVIVTYPKGIARKRAETVLRGSPESVNLMIMSLRHEPSLSKAIRFAARKENAYSRELRRCVWGVVMGVHASFEDALHALGRRWSRYSEELKDSLDSMVIASCESTEEGKRRALDRANATMVSGTKRRIEEYALSLAGPSMIMFGLGILLPLMVGSFLPMLSWNLWSLDDPGDSAAGPSGQSTLDTVLVMNVMFPTIALLVAMSAISKHPLEIPEGNVREGAARTLIWLWVAIGATGICCMAALLLVKGQLLPIVLLMASVGPISIWLMSRRDKGSGDQRSSDLEEALFRTGSKMLDGGNFEAALGEASENLDDSASSLLQRLSYATNALGHDLDDAVIRAEPALGHSNAIQGLMVVKEAASKDEMAAGMLAMDLANYLRDLRELETTLKNRLKPTISMMKMTVYVLGPIVLGITFAIYLSLTSLIDGGDANAGVFFLVLGLFLAETDAVVTYFVWGIGGGRSRGELMYSTGACLLVSEMIFAATATLAA